MNYGVIQPKVNKLDWTSGDTGIVYREVCQDWTPYLPTYEQQRKLEETYACVSFSLLNIIEAQLKQQGKELNLSDRFLAKASGTTNKGNWVQNPPYSFTHDGWLLEEDYPYPENITFQEFYKEIPQELKDKAKKNYENADWTIQYQWLNSGNCNPNLEALKKELKQAPLQIATSYNSGLCNSEHAMMLYKIDSNIWIYDSYRGGIVKQNLDYPLPWIMKIVVAPKVVLPEVIPPVSKNLWYGTWNNEEVKYLQKKLIKLGYLSKGLDTGNYLNLTKQAVYKFQKDYKVASLPILLWNQGRYVGNSTRKVLNSL